LVDRDDLDFRISSGDAIDTKIGRIFSYYAIPRASNALGSSFYLFRKTQKSWIGGRFDWPLSDYSSQGIESCRGGSLSPSVGENFIFITGRVTPSAGCTRVFDLALQPITSLWGMHVRELDRTRLLLHHNQIHFSPEHALKVSIFDLRTREVRTIFPVAPELAPEFPTRVRYRRKIAELYRRCETELECREAFVQDTQPNHSGVPNEDLIELQYNRELDALMMEVRVDDYSHRSFFPKDQWRTPHYWVFYNKLLGKTMVRAVSAGAFKREFGKLRTLESRGLRLPTQAMLDWVWRN
jgi:hypothetical protein